MTDRPTIERYMTPNPLTLSPGMEVNRAAAFLIKHDISGAPVVDETGRLVGILTAKDCFRAVLHASYHQELGGTVDAYMASPVVSLDAGLDIIAAAERFLATPYRRFPVMKEGRLAGIISRLDLLRAFGREW
jgi:CBS domain-containing protein